MLPISILEAAFKRFEDGGQDPFKIHPEHAENKQLIDQTRKLMKDKLTQEEIEAVENAHCIERITYFQVAYAMGFCDGVKTNQALAEIGE